MKVSCAKIKENFPSDIEEILGNPDVEFSTISAIEDPAPDGLTYVLQKKFLSMALSSPSAAVIIHPALKDAVKDSDKTFLVSKLPELLMARISQKYLARNPLKIPREHRIHPTAIIPTNVKLEDGVVIEPYAVLGENVQIGAGSYIGPHTIIEENAKVGSGTIIYGQVFLGYNCQVGNNCILYPQCVLGGEGYGYTKDDKGRTERIPQNGNVVLGDYVDIGAQCVIDRATFDSTTIGEGTKLDNHCHIAHNCQIGKHTLITAGFIVAGSSTIGDHCVFGGNTSVTDHVKIGNHVHLAGLSVVKSDITTPGAYGGHPLQPIKEYLRTTATLAHLPKMRKELAELLREK